MDEAIEVRTPRRGRPPRAETVAVNRRRRKVGSLNRMAQFKLDCIEPEDLDLENYVYRWTNDENSRLRQLTQADDYDFVGLDEIGSGFDKDNTDSESDGRARMLVGTNKGGGPQYAYLLKKRRDFWEADNDAMVAQREDMMAGRVYRAENDDPTGADPGVENVYVPKGNQLGSAAGRRRGPIPRNAK